MCSILYKTICIGRVDGVSRFRVSVRAGEKPSWTRRQNFRSLISPLPKYIRKCGRHVVQTLSTSDRRRSSRENSRVSDTVFRVRVTAHSTAVECVCEKNTYKSSVFSMDPGEGGVTIGRRSCARVFHEKAPTNTRHGRPGVTTTTYQLSRGTRADINFVYC